MKRDDIRQLVDRALSELGYPREWYSWPKPGRLYLLGLDDAIAEHRLPAPLPKYKFRAWLASIPRRGPPIVRRRVTVESWRQPEFGLEFA